jgi:hypothetical protein
MRRKIACITGLIFSLIPLRGASLEPAASGIKAQYDTGYFLTAPEKGALVIIGVASRQLKQAEERDAALDDAARKAAYYMGITGKVIREHRAGGTFFDFSAAVASDIVFDTDYGKYRDALVYDEAKDLLRTSDAVFVRCTYPVPAIHPIPYTARIIDGEPEWIHRRNQEIAGYMAGVGFAAKQRRPSETITKAYESAIIALLSRTSTVVTVRDTDAKGNGAVSEMVAVAEGALSDFFVLETWIDPKTKAVWTLAVAREIITEFLP